MAEKIYLSDLKVGDKARIIGFETSIQNTKNYDQAFFDDLGDRLLELGFEEGLDIEILHEGLFGRNPLSVQIGHVNVALRRIEASAIIVSKE